MLFHILGLLSSLTNLQLVQVSWGICKQEQIVLTCSYSREHSLKEQVFGVQLFTPESSTLWLLEKKYSQQLCGTQKYFFAFRSQNEGTVHSSAAGHFLGQSSCRILWYRSSRWYEPCFWNFLFLFLSFRIGSLQSHSLRILKVTRHRNMMENLLYATLNVQATILFA